ncbi:hypothetical protein WAI453_011165 [Rhynchosporium graminicola]
MKTHTIYERAQSPWNRAVVIWLWSFQTIGSIIITAFAAALLHHRKGLQQRYDDGLADALFVINAYLIFSFTILNAILLIPTYMHYKRNALSPLWMLISSVWLALFWQTGLAMSIYALVWSAGYFEVWEVWNVLTILASIPYFVGLLYYSVVYHKWRKAGKRHVETSNERYSLDSRKLFSDIR